MKRRRVLKQIGAGLSLGWSAPWWLTSCIEPDLTPEIQYDGSVVIVGAGATGLYLANILYSKGIRVRILEASGVIGGRISSYDRINDNKFASRLPIELGANVIYGSDSILGVNLSRAGLPLTEIGSNDFLNQFVMSGAVKSSSDWGTNEDFVVTQGFIDGLSTYSGQPGTINQGTDGFSDNAKALLNSQVGNLYGSSNESIGISGLAANLNARQHNNDLLILRGNLMQQFFFSRFHADNYPITLNAPVTAINYDSSSALVGMTYGKNNQLQANKVIVTVPISILKNNEIVFTPRLPTDMISSMDKIGMGPSIRVILEFKVNFWGESSNFIWGINSAPHCLNLGVGRSENNNILSITINGPKASEFSALGQNMINEILAELDAIYEGQATQYIREDFNTAQVISVIKDWSKEPYIKGGYSYPTALASIDDYAILGKSRGDKLFFAGEATDTKGYAGTINGALNSAERVAEEVIKSITG